MDIFKLWKVSDYTFLVLNSTADGHAIQDSYSAKGVVKLRDDYLEEESMEDRTADSTIYVKPNEEFLAVVGGNMIGHGIEVGKDNYSPRTFRIVRQSKGDDQRGRTAFYRITIRPLDISDES